MGSIRMNKKPYYVVLTGHKINSGDFLIRHKVIDVLNHLRPDRDIVNLCAWQPITDEQLEIVNGSKALLLAGGPSLQKFCYPTVYPLRENLSDIKAPISLFGVGTKAYGKNLNPKYYKFTPESVKLFKKIQDSSIHSSVRDFHSFESLKRHGLSNVIMTGCPVLYDFQYLNKPIPTKLSNMSNIVFSLGVSFVKSPSMEKLMKEMILKLCAQYSANNITVAFHHSLHQHSNQSNQFTTKHNEFLNWIHSLGIKYCDISGNCDSMIDLYSKCDLHIGFRVHAHLLMASLSKPSILFAEDGRAQGFIDVIGGDIYKGYHHYKNSILDRIISKIYHQYDRFNAVRFEELNFENLLNSDHILKSMGIVRNNIDSHFKNMKSYISSLP